MNVTRGIDTMTPGSLVRVISDDGADDPAQSVFIGRTGIVSPDDAGAGVIVPMDGHDYHFMPHELRIETAECSQAHAAPALIKCGACAGSGRDPRRCGCAHGCARCDYTGRSVFACLACDGTGEDIMTSQHR